MNISRWERKGQDGSSWGRRGRREGSAGGGEEGGGGGGKWKHDMFEQLEKEEQQVEDEAQAETKLVRAEIRIAQRRALCKPLLC